MQFELLGILLLRGLLLGRLCLPLLLSPALLPAALTRTIAKTCGLSNFWILLLHFRECFFGGFAAGCADGGLSFTADLGHLRSDFLSQWRAVELQQPFNFVFR